MPNKIVGDRGKELLAESKSIMANDYGILCNSIGVRNLQANTIFERGHQTIGNVMCNFTIQQMDLDNGNPWGGILSYTMFARWSKVYTATQHTGIW